MGFHDARDLKFHDWKNVFPVQTSNILARVAAVTSILCQEVRDVHGVAPIPEVSSQLCELFLKDVDGQGAMQCMRLLFRTYATDGDTLEYIQRGWRELQQWCQRNPNRINYSGKRHEEASRLLYEMMNRQTFIDQRNTNLAMHEPSTQSTVPPLLNRRAESLNFSVEPLLSTPNFQTTITSPVRRPNIPHDGPPKKERTSELSLNIIQNRPANPSILPIPNQAANPISERSQSTPNTDATGLTPLSPELIKQVEVVNCYRGLLFTTPGIRRQDSIRADISKALRFRRAIQNIKTDMASKEEKLLNAQREISEYKAKLEVAEKQIEQFKMKLERAKHAGCRCGHGEGSKKGALGREAAYLQTFMDLDVHGLIG